jgi:hypothetical protein
VIAIYGTKVSNDKLWKWKIVPEYGKDVGRKSYIEDGD